MTVNVIHSVASTRSDHGGPSRSVPSLCEALAELGVTVELVTCNPADSSVFCNYPSNSVPVHMIQESKIHRQWGMARRFGQALEKRLALNGSSQRIIHDHGLWLSTNRAVAHTARKLGIKRVVSPRGMLSDWSMSNGRLKKKIAWWLFQQRDLLKADAFHATGKQEAEDLRSLGFQQPIAVIPNGVVFPDVMPDHHTTSERKQVLFLSRIHPKKGLMNLVRAWCRHRWSYHWQPLLGDNFRRDTP